VQAEEGYDGLKIALNGHTTEFFATGITQTEFKEQKIALIEGTDRITFVQSTLTNTAPVINLPQKPVSSVQNVIYAVA